MSEDDDDPADRAARRGAAPRDRSADDGESPLTPSAAFELLAKERRRCVLYALTDRGGSVHVDDLAARLAGTHHRPRPESPVDGDRRTRGDERANEAERRERIALRHADVPRLADRDVVDYDADSGGITLTARGEALGPYLAVAREREVGETREFLDAGPERG